MKLALFFPENYLAGTYATGGMVRCLTKMGHEVLPVSFPGNCYIKNQRKIEEVKFVPSIEELNSCDAILLCYFEHIVGWIETCYNLQEWKEKLHVPVIARFDESFDRHDLGLPASWSRMKQWAQFYSFPAAQDAEEYGGDFLSWCPFGADIELFHPSGWLQPDYDRAEQYGKKIDVGFIGSLYEKRVHYLNQLLPHLAELNIPFYHGPVQVNDLFGRRFDLESILLAENYGAMKIFFCPPPMSNLIVCKVMEVMACGTLVMYPRLTGDAAKNSMLFEHGKDIVYYNPNDFVGTAKTIEKLLVDDNLRETIATNGMQKVRENYTIEKMFEYILKPVMEKTLSNA